MKKMNKVMGMKEVKNNKNQFTALLKDETGAFGIKEIAITVAVIVIIGFLITAVQGNMDTWVGEIWKIFVDKLEDMIK